MPKRKVQQIGQRSKVSKTFETPDSLLRDVYDSDLASNPPRPFKGEELRWAPLPVAPGVTPSISRAGDSSALLAPAPDRREQNSFYKTRDYW